MPNTALTEFQKEVLHYLHPTRWKLATEILDQLNASRVRDGAREAIAPRIKVALEALVAGGWATTQYRERRVRSRVQGIEYRLTNDGYRDRERVLSTRAPLLGSPVRA